MLAYWQIAKGADPRRAVLSNPASYNDLMHTLLLSRGVDPQELGRGGTGAPRGRRGRRAPAPRVNVVGGRWTRSYEAAGQTWGAANLSKDWKKRTGTADSAIAWALDPDS